MRKIGKKGRAWIRQRALIIKRALAEGRIEIINGTIVGRCEDCKHWHHLTPDHKKNRGTGGKNSYDNIEWVCNEPPCWCHAKRDQQGDPMAKKNKSKKPIWEQEHSCKKCHAVTRQYLCHVCGKVSI